MMMPRMTVARVQRVLDDADVRCLSNQFQISPLSRDFHRPFLLFGAIRGDRAAVEVRGYPPSAVEQLKQELGDTARLILGRGPVL